MPTNEERREVAARLRDFETFRESFNHSPKRGFYHVLKISVLSDWKKICCYLANLIEPEEQTCRMTKKGPEFILAGWWECSECGPVYPPCNDNIAVWALQRCPRCGAKVMEE